MWGKMMKDTSRVERKKIQDWKLCRREKRYEKQQQEEKSDKEK